MFTPRPPQPGPRPGGSHSENLLIDDFFHYATHPFDMDGWQGYLYLGSGSVGVGAGAAAATLIVGPATVAAEVADTAFEEITGIPIIIGPSDFLEAGLKRGVKKLCPNPKSMGDNLLFDSYRNLEKRKDLPGQIHHLNQDAAFRSHIPYRDGVSINLGGSIQEIGTPHWKAHESLEKFWNQFRRGGPNFGRKPTNLEYSRALLESLQRAGLTREQALQAVRESIGQRIGVGQIGGIQLPVLPGRTPIKRPR